MSYAVVHPEGYTLNKDLYESDAKAVALSVFENIGQRCTLVDAADGSEITWPAEGETKKSSKK